MSIHSLLGLTQAAAVAAPNPLDVQQETTDPNQIVVDGASMDPYAYENNPDIVRRDMALEAGRETSDHRGMFGVRGTLRDVLGTVGDAFLMQSGNAPIYAPRRDQERLSDAMSGFTENPIAAIERVAGVNPEAAQAMHEQYLTNRYRNSQAESSALRANVNAGREERLGREQAMDYVSQTYAAAVATGDPAALQEAERLATLVSQQYNIPMDQLGVVPGMTPEQAAVLAGRSATTNQNLRLPQYERGLDISEQNADTSSRRASEQARANRAREDIQRSAEAGRNDRAERVDRRVRELDDGDRGNGPRQLRGSEGNPTSSLRIRPVGQ